GPVIGPQLVEVQWGPGRAHAGARAAQPGVEPLQLDAMELDTLACRQVVPGAHHELVATGDGLVRPHGSTDGTVGPGVLEAGVVERLAALEEVVPAAHQEGRDTVGDDPAQDVGRVACGPV